MPAALPPHVSGSISPMAATSCSSAGRLLIPLFMLALMSYADSPTQIPEPLHYRTQQADWIIYEGLLPSENGQEIQAGSG